MPRQARLDAPDTLYHVQDFEPGGEELVNLVNNVPLEHLYVLREEPESYDANFTPENRAIGPNVSLFLDGLLKYQ
jgi:hypothetical protein